MRAGEVAPAELLALARAQLARVQPALNPVLRELPALADAQLERLAAPGGRGGLLAGVPLLLKDSVSDVAGVPTSYGSRAFAKIVPPVHAAVTRRWLDAGAVIFGKTNLPELGLKGVSDSRAFGRVANPWDVARTPGGSSGGSAAAVAAGVVPMAAGNDGGGSLRIPAACCGLFALKPSRGRISMGPGLGELWFGAASEGVISRSVRDSALALDLLAGPEPGDPFVAAMPPPRPWRELVREAPPRLRIGWSTASPIGTPVHPEAVAAVQSAATLLRELGHELVEASPAIDGDALAQAYLHVYFGQVLAAVRFALGQGAQRSDFEPLTRFTAELGRTIDAGRLSTTLVGWNAFARALGAFHATHDAWLTPTLAEPPLPHGHGDPSRAELALLEVLMATRLARLLGHLRLLDGTLAAIARQNMAPVPFTQLANLSGTPAMSVPLHWGSDGLPLGVQFVGRMGDEATLLQLAAELERARPWFDRLPPIARALATGSAAPGGA